MIASRPGVGVTPTDAAQAAPPLVWHLLTGDYPPTPGGVADHTAQLAQGLVAAGCAVHVYCRGDARGPEREPSGVWVHRVAGRFGWSGLLRLNQELDQAASPRTILVQYVPHAFGFRALNLLLAAWVARRARGGDEVRVLFHEVAYPWVRQPLRHNLIAATNRAMAAILVRASTRVYVAIPAWRPFLQRLGAGNRPVAWTPVPSNIPDTPSRDPTGPAALVDPAGLVVGHFGTYGLAITRLLGPVVRELLDRQPDVRLLLLGAGGERWRAELVADRADWSERIRAPGAQPGPAIRDELRSCACMIQPYPDGVSTRRGTVMAALSNAVPVVTNIGDLSESIWCGGAVVTTSFQSPGPPVDLVGELLGSPDRRAALGSAGRQLYEDRFAIGHTVRILLRPTPDDFLQ